MKKPSAKFVYLTSNFMVGFILSVVFAASQLYRVQTVGLDALQLVLVGTTLEVTAFLFEIPTGVVADVYSRRLSVIIGSILFGLGFLVEGLFPIFGVVLLAQVVWGLGWTFISGAYEAWITDEVGAEHVGPILLRSSQLYEIGSFLGIPVFVWLANISYRVPILVGGALFLGVALLRWWMMTETGFTPTPKEERETWKAMWSTTREGFRLTRLQPTLWAYIGIAIFIGLYSEGYDRLSEKHFIDNFKFPALPWGGDSMVSWFALMRVAGLPLTLAATEIIRRREGALQNHKVVRLLQGIYGGMVLGLLVFAWTRNFYAAVLATLLVDTLRSTASPITTAWLNQFIDSKVRATVLSMISQVDAVGQMAGGPVVGIIGNLRSIRAALTGSALLLAPAVPLFGRARQLEDAESKQQDG
ncbi:MAG TPA: MFS transporter [Chloroflexi bacterium]|nr:MFS transporter [Chloroflexota bacterium]